MRLSLSIIPAVAHTRPPTEPGRTAEMTNADRPQSSGPTSVPPDPTAAAPPLAIPSEDLFRGGREVLIRHESQLYRLRLTRSGKLILTK